MFGFFGNFPFSFRLLGVNCLHSRFISTSFPIFLGQERFGNMTRVYYKEAVGAFIVFDVTRVGTFDAVIKWKQDLDSKVQLPNGSPIPCILLANKVNLVCADSVATNDSMRLFLFSVRSSETRHR